MPRKSKWGQNDKETSEVEKEEGMKDGLFAGL